MKFNADKCKVLHLGNQNPRYEYYRMCDTCLEAAREENDLGIIVDEKLKFDTHTVSQANQANRVLIRRTFDNMDEEMLVLLYTSLVRPHLEYCQAVVYSQYVKSEKMLEAVQRRATRLPMIRERNTQNDWKKLKLPSLYRRRRGDMIEVYKYTHNIYNVAVQPVVVEIRTTHGHSYKLLKKSSSTYQRQKFFSMRVVNSFDSLPELVVTAPSVNTFKGCLNAHWDDLKFVVDFPAHELSK